MKKLTLKVFFSAFMLMFAVAVAAQEKTVAVLAINDMHAYLDRMPQFGAVVDSLKDIYPNLSLQVLATTVQATRSTICTPNHRDR